MSSPSAPCPSPVMGSHWGGESVASNPVDEASDLPSSLLSRDSSFKRRSEVRFSRLCFPSPSPDPAPPPTICRPSETCIVPLAGLWHRIECQLAIVEKSARGYPQVAEVQQSSLFRDGEHRPHAGARRPKLDAELRIASGCARLDSCGKRRRHAGRSAGVPSAVYQGGVAAMDPRNRLRLMARYRRSRYRHNRHFSEGAGAYARRAPQAGGLAGGL